MLEITVHEIRGLCPVHSIGDRILIEGPNIVVAETDALCTHALSTLLHYTTILEHTWCPAALGLTTSEDPAHAYMQCVDPGPPYTEGGTVIFRCRKIVRE
jgi:uncharacterized repeat protein (TIGR04076 family)